MAGGCENRFRPLSDVKRKGRYFALSAVNVVVIVVDPMNRKSEIAVLIIE